MFDSAQVGMARNLIPWIDELEAVSLGQLEKPLNFEHAREMERNTVTFAKEVRKANKLMSKLEGSIENLPDKKMFANQQISDQKQRFKGRPVHQRHKCNVLWGMVYKKADCKLITWTGVQGIATVAATRVETMRELLVNWNFFNECRGEAERLAETTRGMFNLEPLPAELAVDENDFGILLKHQ